MHTKKITIKLWAVLFWLFVWQIVSMQLDQRILLVSPIEVIKRLFELCIKPDFWYTIALSSSKMISGFLLALLAAAIFSVLSYRFKRISELIAPAVLTIKSIPVASFIILALIWFSSSSLAILISFLMVLPVMYSNLLTGIETMDKKMLEMAKVFNISTARQIRYLYIPHIFPYLRAGCTVCLGLCWKSGIAAEVIGMPNNSIGSYLQQAKVYLNTPDVFAWTLVIVCLSLAFEKLFLCLLTLFEKRLQKVV